MIASQPFLQLRQVLFLFHGNRNLVSSESTLYLLSVHHLRARPALWSFQYNHRPGRSFCAAFFSGFFLYCLDFFNTFIHSLCHKLMHSHRVITLYHVWLVSAALEKPFSFLLADTGKYCRITYLVSVKVEYRQNRSIS